MRTCTASQGESAWARGRRSWLASPASASVLAALTLVFAVAMIPLSLAARQNPLTTAGPQIAIWVSFGAVGLVVAWHRPRNLDAVRDDLAGVVHQALEPAHVSLWINQRN